ncbi:histamine N-methyltransferase-like [Acanthaster planci]|uniref:Histamine N-methyltransferase-like n=1 Tax=Acanthaster planci TaxID=133434 RepID=A0A8B7XHA9_ACAPL|nr:histamine N-methyltransferase-like [Acanthaster planci]
MATSTLKSVFHDPDYYTKAFKSYSAVSDKTGVFSRWGDVFEEAVAPQINAKLSKHEELRVLGIGSGTGELDLQMLTKLLPRFPLIHNRVVEPAEDAMDKYQALVQSRAQELQGVRWDWRQQTIDQYTEEARGGDSTKFHFVHACQCLYYAADLESSLTYLYNCVEPGGVMVVSLITETSGMYRLWHHFPSFQDALMKYVSSSDIRGYLTRRGIPYTEHHQSSRVDVTDCFDEASEAGGHVLDIMTHVVKLRETASAELLAEVMQSMAGCSEKSGNRFFITNNWDAAVVNKPVE